MSRQAPRVIIHNDVTADMAGCLRTAMPDAAVTECNDYTGMAALVADFAPDVVYSVKFGGNAGFPTEVLMGPDGPGWVSVGGSGCDHLGAWDAGCKTVTNSAGVAAGMMAEYAFGCLLHFTLDIPGLATDRAAQHWNPLRRVVPLAGKTLLIIGLGQTGQAVAARAKAFGMHVIGTRARPAPLENVDEVHAASDLPALCARADAIVVAVPLLPSTRNLVDAHTIAAMKPGVLLVDVSRGGVIEEAALIDALKSGLIAGAGLDVFVQEPLPPDSPFWSLDSVILSPHCSSVYDGWDLASFDMFIENLGRWRRDEPLRNIVNPARGY